MNTMIDNIHIGIRYADFLRQSYTHNHNIFYTYYVTCIFLQTECNFAKNTQCLFGMMMCITGIICNTWYVITNVKFSYTLILFVS